MKKTIIITSIIILIFLVIRYGGLFIFWLFTPGDGEPSKEELILFEKIKKELKVEKVSREPKYHMSKPKDSATYILIIRYIDCENYKINDLKVYSQQIRKEIDKINLHKNFYKYDIYYECKNGEDIEFSYLRN